MTIMFHTPKELDIQDKINMIVTFRRLGLHGAYYDELENEVINHLRKIKSGTERKKKLPTLIYLNKKLLKKINPLYGTPESKIRCPVDWDALVPREMITHKQMCDLVLGGKSEQEIWNEQKFDEYMKDKLSEETSNETPEPEVIPKTEHDEEIDIDLDFEIIDNDFDNKGPKTYKLRIE